MIERQQEAREKISCVCLFVFILYADTACLCEANIEVSKPIIQQFDRPTFATTSRTLTHLGGGEEQSSYFT